MTDLNKLQAVYEGEGYVAIGFSSDGAMVPGDAVFGLPDEGTVVEYDMAAYVSDCFACFALVRVESSRRRFIGYVPVW